MTITTETDLAGWEVRTSVNQRALYNMLECVMEIAQALQGLVSSVPPGTEAKVSVMPPLMVSSARRISISTRKLMLDGNGSLLKQCVMEPNVHPLRRPYSSSQVRFKQPFGEQRIGLGWTDGASRDIAVPAFNHTISIFPLYGVGHIAGTKFRLYNPFNYDSEPIRYQRWMNTKIIEIDGHQFSAEQLLRDLSNKEGAHIEDNVAFVVPDDVKIDRDKNTLHRLANGVRFGGMTYLQIFSLFTGLYIVNRTRPMLRQLPFSKDNQEVAYICKVIIQSPRNITAEDADIEFPTMPLVALGPDRELMGDYNSGANSSLKVPR